MKNRQVYPKLSRNCAACVMSLAFSLTFLACSSSEDVAGGVTDIGNSVVKPPEYELIAGEVIDVQGNGVAHARVVLYTDGFYSNNKEDFRDSVETVSDSVGHFSFELERECVIMHDSAYINRRKTYSGFENAGSNMFLYAEHEGLSLLVGGMGLEGYYMMQIEKPRTLKGSLDGKSSGYVRLAATDIVSELDENGHFTLEKVPSGRRMELFYVEGDTAKGRLHFATTDSRDTISLPPLEILEGNDGYMTSRDLGYDYGIVTYAPNFVSEDKRREIPLQLHYVEQNAVVYDNDSTLADSVVRVEGIRGYEKAILLLPGQFIDLDTLDPTDGDFTLSLWTKWNGPNGEHQVLFCQRAYWSDSTSRFQWHYEVNSGTFAVMKGMPDYPGAVYFGDSTSVPVGEWAFLVLVSKNHMVSMYVNGKAVAIAGSDGTEFAREFVPNELNRNVPFRIGGDEIETETWNGALDEIWVESIARSPEWIEVMYEQLKP